MKLRSLYYCSLCACASLLLALSSCAKDVFSEDDNGGNDDIPSASVKPVANCALRLVTRSGEDNNATVSYPVHIYIFNANMACVDKLTIESANDDAMKLELPEGTYHICAISGASADDYDIPSKAGAKHNSVVSLKAGRRHGDIMYAYNVVKLVNGEDQQMTLSLKRRVLMLQEVVIDNVPSGATAVSVTVSPLYEGLCIDGYYAADNGACYIPLYKDGDSKVWRSTSPVYMYEAVEGATIKISLTDADGTRGYSYSLTDELQANYKIRIEGTYAAEVGVMLSGTVVGDSWAGERVITFDITGESEDGGTSGGTSSADEAPEAGTMYNGCYVVSSEVQNDNSVRVVLMSPKAKNALITGDEDSDGAVEAAISDAMNSLAVEGIYSWRLPVQDEIAAVLDAKIYKGINNILAAAGYTGYLLPARSYFYRDTTGRICSYGGDREFNKGTYLVPFATIVFR